MVRFAQARVPFRFIVPLFFGIVLGGCRKPDADLGLDLLPGDELGVEVVEAALRAYTFADTAVRTSGLTRNLVGSYVDPDFGSVRTGLVTQLRLTTNNIGLGQDNSGLVADSVVLALAYELPNTHYGNLNTQVFQVHELSQALSVDSIYYTDDHPSVEAEDLVYPHGGSITPRPLVRPVIGNDTLVPQMRIRLKDALAQRFLFEFGTSNLADNAAFLAYFKGLYVSVENGVQAPYQGGILHMNTLSTASKLTVYYKDANNEPDRARTLDFAINSNAVRYTVVERDPDQALTPGLQQAMADTMAPAPTVYLQALGATRAAIRFPGLLGLADRGRALAKAELIIPVQGNFYPYYTPPTQLFLFRPSATGADVFLPDQLSGVGGIGGQYINAENVYKFNITRYVQGVLNGDIPDNGVELVPGSSGVSVNRTILNGPDAPQRPMHLKLTFTTY
jgi:hypothetical protein